MSKQKTIMNGVPVADATGHVTTIPVAELAKQVGAELGVNNASYMVYGPARWVRIAQVNSAAVIFTITNLYQNQPSNGFILAVTGAHHASAANVKLISGRSNIIDKVRLIHDNYGTCYLEAHTMTPVNQGNPWHINSFGTSGGSKKIVLNTDFVEGEIPTGFTAKEFSLSEMGGGYKYRSISALHSFASERRAAA